MSFWPRSSAPIFKIFVKSLQSWINSLADGYLWMKPGVISLVFACMFSVNTVGCGIADPDSAGLFHQLQYAFVQYPFGLVRQHKSISLRDILSFTLEEFCVCRTWFYSSFACCSIFCSASSDNPF